MADFKIKLDMKELERLVSRVPGEIDRAVAIAAQEMVTDIQQGMRDSPADGESYGRHVASSPGNPPRPDLGALVNSINWQPKGTGKAEIRDGVEYGEYLEFGTEHIEPRPFMGPVFEDYSAGKLESILRDELNL